MTKDVKVFPYVIRYTLTYTVALVLLAILTTLTDTDSAGIGTSIAAIIVSVLVAVSKFVRDYERVPSKRERKHLTWLSLGMSVFVSAVLVVLFLGVIGQLKQLLVIFVLFSKLHSGVVFAIIFFTLAMNWVALWFSYGGLAKVQYNSLIRKNR